VDRRKRLTTPLTTNLTALLQIVIGFVLLALAYDGHRKGWIRAGSKGFRPYRPSRDDSPFMFHFYMLVYLAGGLAMIVWGVLVLIGLAAPLPISRGTRVTCPVRSSAP